ncbi:Ff.00g068250.m01.CDS01 [Fusarium sp. VM40]|nr:Ff.00g068250.m01.CDS01 [Fusarium sp. VM40]
MQLENLRSLERIVYFFDCQKNVLGKVYAASGFNNINNNNNKIDGNRRLYWALIKVNKSRIGTNKLPDEEAWLKKAGLEDPILTYGAQHQSQAKIPEAYS